MRRILLTIVLWQMKSTMTLGEEQELVFNPALRNRSYFGYSMAFLNNDLVISAPRADNIGQVYILNTNTSSLDKMSFALKQDYSIHNIDYWLGATVSKGSSFFVTCAPRVKSKPGSSSAITSGKCFSFRRETILKLPESHSATDQKFNGGIDAFGWSINVNALDNVYIGSPVLVGGYVEFYQTNVTAAYILTNTTRTFNFGYGIASGNFLSNDNNDINFAVSTTYGDHGEGEVFIFNSTFKQVYKISNDEVGSMYGATLCTLRLEGKRASLMVGAPTYTTSHHDYDHGAVFLYVPNYSKNASEAMILKRKIKGTSSGGYFGFSIANIGDIDGDGKDDVAIGTPYENDGKGAVYIYSGHGLLTDNTYLKKIDRPKHSSFGFCITPLTDSNGDTSGLAISAPFDNTVIIIKVTPLITTKLSVQIPNLQERKDKSYFEFTACVTITYPRTKKTINSEIIFKTKIIHPYAKLSNTDTDNSHRIELRNRPTTYCKTYQVLTPENGDYGIMIKHNITIAISETKSEKVKSDGTKVDLSDMSVRYLEGEIWAADCNTTYGRCFPKLIVKPSTTLSNPYEVGSYDTERYSIMIKNSGESAYNLCVIVTLHGTYILNVPPLCTRTDTENQVICKPDTVLPNDYSWKTGIEVDTKFVTNIFDKLEIQTDVYNNCNNKTDKQTITESYELIYNVTGINIQGLANPNKDINITIVDVVSGKLLEHLYMIRNSGPMDYLNASFEVILEKREYLNWMFDEESLNCSIVNSTGTVMKDRIKYTCKIENLHRHSDVNVHIPVQILPDSLDKYVKNNSIKFEFISSLNLILKEGTKEKSLTTTLFYKSTSVAAWIIIIAFLIGLIILILIALILREFDFFERKNKKNLEQLRALVRNESTRRLSQRYPKQEQAEQTEGIIELPRPQPHTR